MPDAWRPLQYERFRKERAQPFFDLLDLVRPCAGGRVIDLGCGTGELTRELHAARRPATTLGVDSSEAMLARAAPLAAPPALVFERADIASLAAAWGREAPEPYDVVFSNAALHWLPAHDALLADLTKGVALRGQLAVQVPANHDHPTHMIAAALARDPEFAPHLPGHVGVANVLLPERYASLLHALGYREPHVRLVVYAHVLPGREDVLEWVKGTLLTDYQSRLPAEVFRSFLARYAKLLFDALPDERPFFYAFKRILMWGQRG